MRILHGKMLERNTCRFIPSSDVTVHWMIFVNGFYQNIVFIRTLLRQSFPYEAWFGGIARGYNTIKWSEVVLPPTQTFFGSSRNLEERLRDEP